MNCLILTNYSPQFVNENHFCSIPTLNHILLSRKKNQPILSQHKFNFNFIPSLFLFIYLFVCFIFHPPPSNTQHPTSNMSPAYVQRFGKRIQILLQLNMWKFLKCVINGARWFKFWCIRIQFWSSSFPFNGLN